MSTGVRIQLWPSSSMTAHRAASETKYSGALSAVAWCGRESSLSRWTGVCALRHSPRCPLTSGARREQRSDMAGNRGVAYIGPGTVEVQDIDYPKLELQDGPGVNPANVGRKLN